uniref:Phosphorylated adapter RNA export protein n=1 Tax=Plectus sambesii TaxID=2011161 RepID=A0A914VXT2_9BILA
MASSFRQTRVPSDGECSDSDDDSRPSLKRYRPEPPDLLESIPSSQRHGAKFNIWSDVLTDQTLSAQMSSNVGVRQAESRVEREAESYDAPVSTRKFNRPPGFRGARGGREHRRGGRGRGAVAVSAERLNAKMEESRDEATMPASNLGGVEVPLSLDVCDTMEDSNDAPERKTAPPPPSPNDVDDPFDNTFYDDPVEEMGVKPTSSSMMHVPTDPFPRDSRSPHRGRGGGSFQRGQQRGRGRGVKRPLPSSRGGKNDPRTSTVSTNYSLEALQAVDFPEGMTPAELGAKMAQALGEVKPDVIILAVETVGEEKALSLFNDTREAEAVGGILVNDKSRRRTPGGVFLYLLRGDDSISKEDKVGRHPLDRCSKYRRLATVFDD